MTSDKTKAGKINQAAKAMNAAPHATKARKPSAKTKSQAKTPSRESLHVGLMKMAQLRREPVDALMLRGLLESCSPTSSVLEILNKVAQGMNWSPPRWLKAADAARCPLLMIGADGRVALVTGLDNDRQWVVMLWDESKQQFSETLVSQFAKTDRFVRLQMLSHFKAGQSPSLRIILGEMLSQKKALVDIIACSLVIFLLTIIVSFYSMQVYDRVIPTQAMSTLYVLTIGVFICLLFEQLAKWVRSSLLHRLTDNVDQQLARTVFGRFLALRLDQLPSSVGTTASRMKSYEAVRSFLVHATTHVCVDAPLAVIGVVVMFMIGGNLAVIPVAFFALSVVAGLFIRHRIQFWTKQAKPLQHQKTGLLVESIEGAEIIKSGQGGWRMLSRWLDITDQSRSLESNIQRLTEKTHQFSGLFQQLSYVLVVAYGAWLIGEGSDLTMGGMIACSILAGRALAPVALLPQQIVQWAQTKESLKDLDRLWALEADHPKSVQPIVVDHLKGLFELEGVQFDYQDRMALQIAHLVIQPGERVGVLGSVGSGKTTLLRLLSGMYKPQQGRIRLDHIDLDGIAKSSLSKAIGYVPQDGRLFAGTLRENLMLGLPDPGDEVLLQVALKTGLLDAVIKAHPKGLDQEILEGGAGLSGGQRQLVHVTRAMLRSPRIWLLDEPTASMDGGLENQVIAALKTSLDEDPSRSLILVTHKVHLLSLVDRVIICSHHSISADGPRDAILQALADIAKRKPAPLPEAVTERKPTAGVLPL